jgi:hypothetical protein
MRRAEAARRTSEAAQQAADKERELMRLQAIATANYFAGGSGSGAPIKPPNMQLILDYNAASASAAADAAAAAAAAAGPAVSFPRVGGAAERDRGSRGPELIPLGLPPEAAGAGSGAATPRRVISVAGAPRAPAAGPTVELLDAGDVHEFDVLRKQYGAPPTLRKATAAAGSPRGGVSQQGGLPGGLSSPYTQPVLAAKPGTAAAAPAKAAQAQAQAQAAPQPAAPKEAPSPALDASRPGHTLVPPTTMQRL